MSRIVVSALRIVIAMVVAGSLCVQLAMVLLAAADLDDGAELAPVRWPIVVIVALGALTVEVVAVCVWRLLTMVDRGTLFSKRAFRYVDGVVGAVGSACLLLLGLGVTLAPGEAVPPGMVLLIGGVAVVVAGVGLLALVLRLVLAQAVDRDLEVVRLRDEMATVI